MFKRKNKKSGVDYHSIANSLLSIQLAPKYQSPKKAFGELMTNKLASGYVFGFHDCLLQRMGHYNHVNPEQSSKLIEESYKNIFGEQAGYTLFSMSLTHQDNVRFQEGRMEGGNDISEYIENKTPPLGLGRILVLNTEPQSSVNKKNPLHEFTQEIETWPEEQAKTALLLLKATISGNQNEIDRLYQDLTISQLKAVENVLHKMEE